MIGVKVWVDAQVSPAIAHWMRQAFDIDAVAVRDLGLREAEDSPIFWLARDAGALVMTKDADFVRLLGQYGPHTTSRLASLRQHVECLAPGHP